MNSDEWNENWIDRITEGKFYNLVVATLAVVEDSLEVLLDMDKNCPINKYSPDLIQMIKKWLDNPNKTTANVLYDYIPQAEKLANKASGYFPADWWNYEAIEEISFILVAISQKHGFLTKTKYFPDEPERLLKEVNRYFCLFPYSRPRGYDHIQNCIGIKLKERKT